MRTIAKDTLKKLCKRVVIIVACVSLVGAAIVAGLWRDRPDFGDINWPAHPTAEEIAGSVTVTWLGVTTLLFDDGETQILIDGFFSRPTISDMLFSRPVQSDAATINYVLNEYGMNRIAAIIPVHSHFDHAMDIGAIANRTSASILGSSTTVQIARGAGVPEDQIVLASSDTEYSFGNFTVTLVDSVHAPIGWAGSIPFAGVIDKPLVPPAPVSSWREGGSYSVLIEHPNGATLVQGGAGFIAGRVQDLRADVVMLGVGQLQGLGREYAERYWQELVTATEAKRVFPIHFDDLTRPFGQVELPPRAMNDFVKICNWLETIRETWDKEARLYVPIFGQPVVLYPLAPPEA